MDRRALLPITVGITGLAIALGISVDPSLSAQLGLDQLLSRLENAYLVVAVSGMIAFSWAMVAAMIWTISGIEETTLPLVEDITAVRAPGSEVDQAVSELIGERGRAVRDITHREAIQERLTRDATRTVARTRSVPVPDAESMVRTGEWTEDGFATDFVGDEEAPGPSALQRLIRRVYRKDAFEIRVERTIDALEALEEGSG